MNLLASTDAALRTSLTFTGIPLGWVVLFVAVFAAASFWAYTRWAATLKPWQRYLLAALRVLTLAVLFFLLAKPVLSLTREIPVREALIVLFDNSLSMTIGDARISPEDLIRAGLATGAADPAQGLKQTPPSDNKLSGLSRADLLEALRTNEKLNLWQRIAEKTDLVLYSFSRETTPMGVVQKDSNSGVDVIEAVKLSEFTGESTALGDALRTVLDANRGRSLAGVFLLSDGAGNAGLPPAEAALSARADGLPIYAYGVGVTQPRDISVKAVDGPRIGFVNDRVEYKSRLEFGNLEGRSVVVSLLADGREVDKKSVAANDSGPVEVTLGFVPPEGGEMEITVKAEPVEGEANSENNELSTGLRVLADKIRVLYIEGSPRWDFRYLLATLLRDRRLEVKTYLFNADPDLDKLPNSPYLKELPSAKEDLFGYQIIILGDVDPAKLGESRMELLKQWVGEIAGGLIFLAGPEFNPIAYRDTPLQALLPVELPASIEIDAYQKRYPDLRPLRLTPTGENSQYFQADPDPLVNRRIWKDFPGVRWTAAVGPAKPGAEVIAEDADPSRGAKPVPVVAMQNFGSGQTIYFGTDETYRWRSRTGEKIYLGFWGRIIQSLSMHRLSGASQLVQLRADLPRYFVGDQVTISGRIYQKNFDPLAVPSVPGLLKIAAPGVGGTAAPEKVRELSLSLNPNEPGEYSVEFKADEPGLYRFSSVRDPEAVVEFEVVEPRIELLDTALNAGLLEALATNTNGKFLREEDLNSLPDLLTERGKTVPRHEQVPLFDSPWWLILLGVLLCTEWTFRRLWQLK